MSALVRLEKMHFSSPFQATRICLLNKEGSEPVIITHHTLGSMKVTLAILKPRVCGGCSKHCIIAAASIPTINAKKPRRNGSSPRNCQDLRVKWNPNLSYKQLLLLQMLRLFFGSFLSKQFVCSFPTVQGADRQVETDTRKFSSGVLSASWSPLVWPMRWANLGNYKVRVAGPQKARSSLKRLRVSLACRQC